MLQEGVYVIGFSYPVVPQGKARIRTQMCANHTREDLDRAIEAFAKVGRELHVIPSRNLLMKGFGQTRRAPGIWMEEVPPPLLVHQ